MIGLALVTGCGGDDDSNGGRKKLKNAITVEQVGALKLDTPRAQIEARLGPPARNPTFVPRQIRTHESKGSTCTYYRLKRSPGGGGGPKDLAQLCYKKGLLGSKLSLAVPAK